MTSQLGGYRVLREIGRGGMGVVYLAHDPRLDRQVAIKMLPAGLGASDALERFTREARTLARLNHPNVATVFDVGEHDGSRFLVMELVEGETLQETLRRGPLSADEALAVVTQVAEGLAAAHAHQVVHRDLKPGNVIRTRDGRVKILDFGLATTAGDHRPEGGEDATAEMHVVGTVGYMSPEQIRGQPVDARSDVFAFGIVLYEMLTGARPFRGDSRADVAASTLTADPVPARERNPRVPAELERVIGRCLAKNAGQRYASAAALLEDLRAVPATGAGPPAESASVAVLPFTNLSADPENEYFADGMAEEIIGALCRVDALRVAARTSSFAFKGRAEDVRKIGRDLGVSTVLEGSVRRAGNRLRITAQLVKAADGYHLWSAKFDRDLQDVFAVQDEIAENIASALRVVLGDSERRAIRKLRTADPRAHDAYLRGLAAVRGVSDRGIREGERYFRRAVEIDPGYAMAWAGLAEALGWIYDWIEKDEMVLHSLDEASLRAVQIDPDLPEAHAARGQALTRRGKLDEARRAFDEAIRLNPRSYEVLWFAGRARMHDGDLAGGADLFLRAAEVRPEDYQAAGLASTCLHGLGRLDEEKQAARRCLDAVDKALVLNPDDVRAVYFAANARTALGEREAALELARRALAMSDEAGTRYNVACVFANQGETEAALDLLERSVATGWGNRSWLENDPDMDPLRDHPRFRALLERMSARVK